MYLPKTVKQILNHRLNLEMIIKLYKLIKKHG